MSAHVYHEGLPNYHPDAILQDGCPECESRAGIHGLTHLDHRNAHEVVQRAIDWNYDRVGVASEADARLLRAVWSMLLFLEHTTARAPLAGGLPWIPSEVEDDE